MVDKTVVEVLTTKMGITSSSLDLENTLLNRQEGNIEGSSTKIEDEDVALARNLLVETVSNGNCDEFIDNTEDVETENVDGNRC